MDSVPWPKTAGKDDGLVDVEVEFGQDPTSFLVNVNLMI